VIEPEHPFADDQPAASRGRESLRCVAELLLPGGDASEITTNLWGFAQFAYLDNPLPSLFKERSSFTCPGFASSATALPATSASWSASGGRRRSVSSSGDRRAGSSADPPPAAAGRRAGDSPDASGNRRCTLPSAGIGLGGRGSRLRCATHVFLQTPQAARCLEVLRKTFTDALFQNLMVFLAFVRTAHYWTKVHPELGFEDDVKQLFATHEALAECVLNDPEASACEMTR
jgi:hypothetical protein